MRVREHREPASVAPVRRRPNPATYAAPAPPPAAPRPVASPRRPRAGGVRQGPTAGFPPAAPPPAPRPVAAPRRPARGSARSVGRLPGAWPWDHVQGTALASGGSVSSLAVTLANPVAAGDLVVVAGVSVSGRTNSVSDSRGNTYSPVAARSDGTALVQVWACQVASSGPLTVTLASSAAGVLDLAVREYRYLPGGPVGPAGTASLVSDSAAPSAGPIAFRGTALDYAVAANYYAVQGATTAGSGYVLRDSIPLAAGSAWGLSTEDRPGDSGGSATPSFAFAHAANWVEVAAVFLPVGTLRSPRPVASPRRPPPGRVRQGPGPGPPAAPPPPPPPRVAWAIRPPPPPPRGAVWLPTCFELGLFVPPPPSAYGETDPDAAALVPWGPGAAPPILAASDPDAAALVPWGPGAAPTILAASDPDGASTLP